MLPCHCTFFLVHDSLSVPGLPGTDSRAPDGNFNPVLLANTAEMSLHAVIAGTRCRASDSQSLSLLTLFLPFHFQTSKNQIKVDLVDENFTELKGEIAGPPDTPYEGNCYL